MIKEVLYNYLGTNGTITSPVHLEDIYYTRSLRLIADEKKSLKNKNKDMLSKTVIIPEDELNQWTEIPDPAGQN